jgi:hypothetical protein
MKARVGGLAGSDNRKHPLNKLFFGLPVVYALVIKSRTKNKL